MKNRLGIIVSLLLILALDGLVLAEKMDGGHPSLSPDGISLTQKQRRKRRRRARTRRPTSYPMVIAPEQGATPEAMPPPPPPAPAQQEMPNTGAAPPAPSSPADSPGTGRPAKKAGPTRIKPPTVQIKPPTR